MTPHSFSYKRLPGTGLRRESLAVAFRGRLWLEKDHLLLAERFYFREKYRRFYFKDIQALVTIRTNRRLQFSVAFSVMLIIAAAACFATEGGWRIFWAYPSGLFALLLLINEIKGKSCQTFIQTAVQFEELASLRRVRRANKVIAMIEPHISAMQSSEAPASALVSEPVDAGTTPFSGAVAP